MSRDGCMAFPRGAMGLSAVCDWGISYSLFAKKPYMFVIFQGEGVCTPCPPPSRSAHVISTIWMLETAVD